MSKVGRRGWNPWAALRARRDVELVITPLPPACGGAAYWAPEDLPAVIVLDRGLTQVERNAALAHELVHHERGLVGCRRVDERGVEDEVARRLVPVDDLAALRAIAELNELTVEAWQVAEDFGVPDAVALRAMRLLDSA